MKDRKIARTTGALAAGLAVGAAGFLLVAGDATAAPKEARRGKQAAVVGRVEVPLGLQGARGAGINVVVPFTLVDSTRRASDLEVEYGIDLNGDGQIAEDEYRPATEDRLDPRNTRKNRKPQIWVTAGDIGATHAFVWRSTADLQSGRHETLLYRYTDQGRLIPDPAHPGEYLFDDAQAGVKVRIRAARGTGKKRLVGDWVYTEPFSLNNNTPPDVTIDAVQPNASGTASDEDVFISWTAIDADSEDLNGDGVFQPGEDLNGNSVLDREQVGVAFDYYRLQPGETASTFTPEYLESIADKWSPCTRAEGLGDTDSVRAAGAEAIYGTPGGQQYTFVWDSIADVGTVNAQFILRARGVDAKFENGTYVYLTQPFTVDNWKVFASAAAGNDPIALASARTGCTVTNLVPGLDRSDASYGAPFQQVIVAGGASTAAGLPVTNVDVFLINTQDADTTTATPVPFTSFQVARRNHTATALADGRVIFAGGFGANGEPLTTTEIYDPSTRSITPGPDLRVARAKHTAVLLSTGDVAFIGGVSGTGGSTALDSVELYRFAPVGEPEIANDLLAPTLPAAQHSARAVLLPDHQVLVIGGIQGATDAGAPVAQAALIDPMAGAVAAGTPGGAKSRVPTILTIPGPATPRTFAGATVLLDGNVLVSGGSAGGAVVSSLELFNWSNHQFETVTPDSAIAARADHVATTLGDGTVLLAGGTANDPSGATPGAVGSANVLRIVGGAGNRTATVLPVNGDMVVARRGANADVIMNGRPFIAGGLDAFGQATATCEVFAPEASRNYAPSVYVNLPSSDLSHAYGATINYRLIDGEGDDCAIQAQFSLPGSGLKTWRACTAQPDTIGGDVADPTAGLTASAQDITHDQLPIDPVARNTVGDHIFIWQMSNDIDAPAVGTSIPGYNVRIIPFGAVRGAAAVSEPVNVLQNTKPLVYLMPLEDAIGAVNPRQGGDIRLTAHVRDIDGFPRPNNGNECSVFFEYAIDLNGDGLITGPLEAYRRMTPAGEVLASLGSNPVANVQSWTEAQDDPSAEPATRPADKGWVNFDWDALYDIGVPPSSLNFEQRNIWIRVTATDTDVGFPRVLRNRSNGPEEFVYVRDAEALYFESFRAAGDAVAPIDQVKVNEPIILTFNGTIDPATVNATTVRIYRGGRNILGAYNVDTSSVPGKSLVTFYPQVQGLNNGSLQYAPTDANTIFFQFSSSPNDDYRIDVAGYTGGQSPLNGTMVRPLGYASATSTFRAVHSSTINGTSDTRYRFNTTSGYYNDSQSVSRTTSATGGTVSSNQSLTIQYNHAIDVTTVNNGPLTVRGANGQAYVVPGRWTVLNTVNADGTSSSTLTFNPLYKYPSGDQVAITANASLRGTNGTSNDTLTPTTWSVIGYGRTAGAYTETFSDTTQNDSTYTTSNWGDDACAAGTLTGLQDGSASPIGGSALTVVSGQTYTLGPGALWDFSSITVQRGGTLALRSTSGPITVRSTGNITIDGVVDFAGEEGYTGHNSYASSTSYSTSGSSYTSGRAGGTGYNGGGGGGASSAFNSSSVYLYQGDNGTAGSGTSVTGGGGGRTQTYSSTYSYGVGGGAGGGHATPGFAGGNASSYIWYISSTYSSYAPFSTAGGTGGAADFATSGITAGGGGGGGGWTRNSTSTSASYNWKGGGGGAGGGAATFVCNGQFILSASGYINGQGGQGGGKQHYAGAGGGGAGGSCWIKSGQPAQIDGVIDLRGGRGGPVGNAYYSETYHYYYATTYGTSRYGGDGGLGRLMIEAPNYVGTIDNVRVFGALQTRQVASLPTTSIGTSTTPSAFTTTGGTGTFTLDLNGATDIRYASLDIVAGRIVKLRNGTTSTNKGVRIWVNGNVNINGVLDLAANGCGFGNTGGIGSLVGDYAPFTNATQAGYTMWGTYYYYYPSSSMYTTGYLGVVGGGTGGKPWFNTQTGNTNYNREAGDGTGPAPGRHKINSGRPAYSSYYFSGDSGGGGAGNASPGRTGHAPFCLSPLYNYAGSTSSDTSGTGIPGATRIAAGGPAGSNVDARTISVTTTPNFPGSGGGGGNSGGYYQYYYAIAGMGGGGGGAVAIVAQGAINVASGAEITAKGGDGNPPGASYYYYYCHGAGGGGSGGTVYLAGNTVSIAPVTIGEGASANGATFNLRGGYGGGWRQPWSGTRNRYPWYNCYDQFGGDGGYGRLVIDYRTSLNSGRAVANRWGYEQTVFHENAAEQQYRALAGSATFKCRSRPGGSLFRSQFMDLGSLRPQVTSMSWTANTNIQFTLQGVGAQSHPSNPGTGGTGEADTSNTTTVTVASGSTTSGAVGLNVDGWRWWRFQGSIARLSSASGTPSPTLDNIAQSWNKDL